MSGSPSTQFAVSWLRLNVAHLKVLIPTIIPFAQTNNTWPKLCVVEDPVARRAAGQRCGRPVVADARTDQRPRCPTPLPSKVNQPAGTVSHGKRLSTEIKLTQVSDLIPNEMIISLPQLQIAVICGVPAQFSKLLLVLPRSRNGLTTSRNSLAPQTFGKCQAGLDVDGLPALLLTFGRGAWSGRFPDFRREQDIRRIAVMVEWKVGTDV